MTLDLDWRTLFLPTVPILEIALRGTVMYLVLFVILRLAFKRIGGSIGLGDLLMVALVAAASQNAIARDQHSLSDGTLLVMTVAFWNYALDWLGHRFPAVQRFYEPPPLLLVRKGQLIHRHLRAELLTEDELLRHVRRAGLSSLDQVDQAYIEGDGSITVIPRKRNKRARPSGS